MKGRQLTAPAKQRINVHFSGRVQGVGFRFRTSEVAMRYAVSGFVKNLNDGRVQMVAEGTNKELTAFLSAVRKTMRANIANDTVQNSDATGEFEEFTIRR